MVLARIRTASPPGSRPPIGQVERRYRGPGGTTDPEWTTSAGDPARFAERVADYRAGVTTCAAEAVAAAVSAALELHQASRVAVPAGLPDSWIPAGLGVAVDDPPLPVLALDRIDAVLTGCALAVAETGTIVLDHGSGQGRRALTLVPDFHVVIVPASRIVAGVPDAVAALDPERPQTWISGPSATSDIELDRVEGVHGPRTLEVVIVEGT